DRGGGPVALLCPVVRARRDARRCCPGAAQAECEARLGSNAASCDQCIRLTPGFNPSRVGGTFGPRLSRRALGPLVDSLAGSTRGMHNARNVPGYHIVRMGALELNGARNGSITRAFVTH